MIQKLVAIALLLALLGLIVTGCSSEAQENKTNQLIPAVEAVVARYGALPLTERLSGVVKAKNQVAIYPEVSAPIVQVHVVNGDVVEKGDPLVTLRDRDLREQLKQAKAEYQIAVAQSRQADAHLKEINAELSRAETLAKQNLSSDAELQSVQTKAASAEADLDLAKARVEQAQATVDEREEALSRTVVRAPVSGSVGNRNAEVGMLVDKNTKLFTLGKLDSVKVEVVLTDRMLEYIEAGQRTDIIADNSAEGTFSAPLTRISPFLHPVTHSTDAEIDLANPNGKLKSGQFVTVDVYYGESEKATLVPLSALYENPATGETGVYETEDSLLNDVSTDVVPGQKPPLTDAVEFKFVPVDVIAEGRMSAGVKGVDAGSWVVTIGQDLLGSRSGVARVRPVNWAWVEQLQSMQREDLLQEVMKEQQSDAAGDTLSENNQPISR